MGNEALADAILSAAKLQTFSRRSRLISAGETDDCAYFILDGAVCVHVNGQLVDRKGQSDSIGELGAKRAGSPRTADVKVSSNKLIVLRVEGRRFRALLSEHESFRRNLETLVDSMNRQKIAQLGERKLPTNWFFISAVIAIVCGVAAHLLLGQLGVTMIFAAATFLVSQRLNPKLSYRLMAKSTLLALIGFALFGGVNLAWSASGNLIEPFGINIASESSIDTFAFVPILIVLLIVFVTCVVADRLTNR